MDRESKDLAAQKKLTLTLSAIENSHPGSETTAAASSPNLDTLAIKP